MTRRAGQRGFTLVEMMVSMAIAIIVAGTLAGTFLVGYRTISSEARTIAADTAVSEASMSLVRDLNSANVLVPGSIAGLSTVTLNYGSPPGTTVVYSIAQGNLIRTVNGTPQVAARGVTSVTITVAGCYATVSILPSATGATAVTLDVSNRPAGCF